MKEFHIVATFRYDILDRKDHQWFHGIMKIKAESEHDARRNALERHFALAHIVKFLTVTKVKA